MVRPKKKKSVLVDLEFYKKERLDESFLRMFGGAIKMLLQHMFEDASAPVEVRGTKSEIKAFADVLGKEKRYMQAYSDLGLNNPATYKSKYLLDQAIENFEGKTGITWPLK